jgi:epoxyqueuosine reductase
MSPAKQIKQKALELGFDLAGITDASPIDDQQVGLLRDWLKAGFAGQMAYMHRNLEKRINPGELLCGAKSVIVTGLNYKPAQTQSRPPCPDAPMGKVAAYARYEDYHGFMKNQLRRLVEFITSNIDGEHEFKICVDSAPLAERALAARAGLGFIGRNHMLIHPQLGPQILLGEIVTTLKLAADKPIEQTCSNCSRCIASCPTGALGADGRFDANKCISYLTIEYKDEIPPELAGKVGERLFGCDACVLACPYCESGPVCGNGDFRFYADRERVGLEKLLNLEQEEFEEEFGDSPMKRAGLEKLKRNAKTCLKNIRS